MTSSQCYMGLGSASASAITRLEPSLLDCITLPTLTIVGIILSKTRAMIYDGVRIFCDAVLNGTIILSVLHSGPFFRHFTYSF